MYHYNYRSKLSNCFYVILMYFLCCLIIIQCRGMWLSSPKYYKPVYCFVNKYVVIVGIVLSFVCLIRDKAIIMNKINRAIVAFFLLSVYFGVFIYNNGYNSQLFLTEFVKPTVVLAVLFIALMDKNDREKFILCYINIIFIVAIISLTFWLLGSVCNYITANDEIYSRWSGEVIPSYYNIYFEPQKISFLGIYKGVRNSACFTEAPMSAYHFFLAALFNKKIFKCNIKQIVLLLAILSTFSTTCIIGVLFVYTFDVIKKCYKNNYLRIIIPILAIVSVVVIIKLLSKRLATLSGNVRIDDIKACLLAWKDRPIWGNGYGNGEVLLKYIAEWRNGNYGSSNSYFVILSQGGIYLLFLYFVFFVKALVQSVFNKSLDYIVFVITLFGVTMVTVVSYQWLLMVVLFEIGFMFNKTERCYRINFFRREMKLE